MPSKHKTPLLGWHPPAELGAWVRKEAERRGVPLSSVLNEAVERLRDARKADRRSNDDCKHPGVGHKHRCPKCGGYNV